MAENKLSDPLNSGAVEYEENDDSKYTEIVGVHRNRPSSYYVDVASNILRFRGKMKVQGRDAAVNLVETLKKQRICVVEHLDVVMSRKIKDSIATFTKMYIFSLSAGEFAEFISGYKLDQMVAVFKKYDTENTCTLSVRMVKSFEFGHKFKACATQRRKGLEYLEGFDRQNKSLNLAHFIEYTSILIHPFLKNDIFEYAISELAGTNTL